MGVLKFQWNRAIIIAPMEVAAQYEKTQIGKSPDGVDELPITPQLNTIAGFNIIIPEIPIIAVSSLRYIKIANMNAPPENKMEPVNVAQRSTSTFIKYI